MAGGSGRGGGAGRPSAPARLALALVLSVVGAGCGLIGGSGSHSSRQTHPTVSSAAVPSTTTLPGVQTRGPRTVLSPIGLHVRAAPSLSAKVLGTAAQGTVLEVLVHTAQAGGWYEVKGATVTGWISGNPSLSAPGTFKDFTSGAHQFRALYPAAWTVADSPANVTFRAPAGGEAIVVTTAPAIAKLGRVGSGYRHIQTETMVACGVTGDLDAYTQEGASGSAALPPYYALIRLALDRKHALGIAASFRDLSGLQPLRDFANSITFPFPECQR